jgi:RND family efflux transporter MFP subunit
MTVIVSLCLAAPSALAEKTLMVSSAQRDTLMTGYTRSSKKVTVASEISGKVVRVNYKIGDQITDRPIVEIDTTFIALSLESSQLQIRQIDSRIKTMQSTVDFLEKSQLRMQELKKTQNIAEVKYDESANKYTEAKNELDSLKCEKTKLQLAHRQLKEEMSRHRIYGFRGGYITALNIEEGEVVQPGIPFAEVSDFNTLFVPFSATTEEINAFRSLPSPFDGTLNGMPVKAKINHINPKFDEKTRKQEIVLSIRDFSGDHRGGLKFQTRIKMKTDGILIPRMAVRNRFGNPKVMVKSTREIVPVMILGESGDDLIVAQTLKLPIGTILLPSDNPAHGG